MASRDLKKIVTQLDEIDIKILEIVKEREGKVNIRTIARELKIDVATCSRHIKKLESLGLVTTHEIGPSKVPFLTALGLEVLTRLSTQQG